MPPLLPVVPEDPSSTLARCGLRATQQRVAVLRLLRELDTHPSAIELYQRLHGDYPNLSRKTVYEVLDALMRAGLASSVTDGAEPLRYEANPAPHYHARCRVCDRLYDLPACADESIRRDTELPEGFRIDAIRVTLVGRCDRCRDQI